MIFKNKIIAVDFDGTLCENEYPEIGAPKKDVIYDLITEQENGARLILWTCRTGEKLHEAIKWCGSRWIFFDAINTNLPEKIIEFNGDPRKIYADEYWDDRAITKGV